MDKQKILEQTEKYIKDLLTGEGSGHDWWHIYRVRNNAFLIAENENEADLFIVQLGALLHDIADWKFYDGDENIGPQKAAEWLESVGTDEDTIEKVKHIVKNLSYKGAGVQNTMVLFEGKIVQDADRLDAIGAIGIARTFAYGGHKNRELYDPDVKPVAHQSADAYVKNTSPTINHFYEKLLLLKDLMNTESAKKIAQERHEFMELYLDRFYKEWEGKQY